MGGAAPRAGRARAAATRGCNFSTAARGRVKFLPPACARRIRGGKLRGYNKLIKNEMLFFDFINHCIIDSEAFGVV